ncbi:MAG: DNA-binding protein [Nanoarchaeota archaeon]|nr:DNA-binding protein [Nanoarchaeota archaeon]
MNIDKLFLDNNFLHKEIDFFTTRKHIRKITNNPELVASHIKKAKHNLSFFKLNKEYTEYNDWLIVTLYYALYHTALALITKKEYACKNHYATILLLIKEYSISQQEIELINNLSINKRDAELYTNLKGDRHDASYSTETKFTKELINTYQKEVLNFINKAEEIILNG